MLLGRRSFRLILTSLVIVSFIFVPVFSTKAQKSNHSFPRLANFYLKWTLTESEARQLSNWDLVVLDMEIQYRYPELLRKIRQWNPDIILLVYITPQEIIKDAATSYSEMRRQLVQNIHSDWYLSNASGNRLTWWPGTYLLNVTNQTPISQGQRFNEYLIKFVTQDLLGSGLWDGVFYDNAWDNITYFAGLDIDSNRDGRVDENADELWRSGLRFIYTETRRLARPGTIIVGNGTTRAYREELDGTILENFIAPAWSPTMQTYKFNQGDGQINIINANTGNRGGQDRYQDVRFGLGSTLLEDGYFSYDFGDKDHGQLWRYDEYDINLGKSVNTSVSQFNYSNYQPDVWRRDFEHGLALVNSTDKIQIVALAGEYEKIHGKQDPNINDGSIISETKLSPYDGLLLLKTFATLDDNLFTNGAFARFFHPDGTRARNGFFVFDESYKGGTQIMRLNMNRKNGRELLIVKGNKIQVWRDDGQPYMKVYPYTVNYRGELRVTVGDIIGDERAEIIVAPDFSFTLPIKIYSLGGRKLVEDWYPFGQNYTGGYSLAVAKTQGKKQIVIGVGLNVEPRVALFNSDLKLQNSWLAFEPIFRGGINVAAGDFDNDGNDEVIVGAGPGKKPIIKTFSSSGKQLSSFMAYSTSDTPGIQVGAVDVDFDGKKDIVGFSSGIGL